MYKTERLGLNRKLLITYLLIMFMVTLFMMTFFILNLRANNREANLNRVRIIHEELVSVFTTANARTTRILEDLYRTSMELQDTIAYLELTEEQFLDHRLNTFVESTQIHYRGVEQFFFGMLRSDASIESIHLISTVLQEHTIFTPDGHMVRSPYSSFTETNPLKTLTPPVTDNLSDGSISFFRDIRNPVTLNTIGYMVVHFTISPIEVILAHEPEIPILILDETNQVVFQNNNVALFQQVTYTSEITPNYFQHAFIFDQEVNGYRILTYMSQAQASSLSNITWLTIMLVYIAALGLGTSFIFTYLRRLSKRLQHILLGMDYVRQGDLSYRLVTAQKRDELDVISNNFNQMCEELERYIERSYAAEIEQKNVEIMALQSQINPHFLYNTLESIRMKAITNGDREVGKMLFILSVLFRSQVKDSNLIPLAKELYYCKKNLELFEFRYPGKFRFEIECEEHLLTCEVIKFMIQPIVENYFVHGIRLKDDDNVLRIVVEEVQKVGDHCLNDILIHIIDNGKGMSCQDIQRKNEQLKYAPKEQTESIGVNNVNRRIRSIYGDEYGVKLHANHGMGLDVCIRIPKREIGELIGEYNEDNDRRR